MRSADGAFPIAPTLRSPAKEFGPRANRTIAKILEAARAMFLTRGYVGTTIDEIAKVAQLSRSSFYTYFPTKRDVLLALGADYARAGTAVVERLATRSRGWTPEDVEGFVADYFVMLDDHGAFAFAWTQAAHDDAEILAAGRPRHLAMARRFGEIMGELRGRPFDDPTARGLAMFSMLERAWSYCQLYEGAIAGARVQREAAAVLAATMRAEGKRA